MDRVFESDVSATPPALPVPAAAGYPQNGGATASPTVPGAYWFHMITESLRNVITGAGLTPLASDLTLLAQAISVMAGGSGMPAGAVAYFACSVAPDGWLIADGRIVSRDSYAALFAAIGTAFGSGDGVTTFHLPDLRGEFIRSLDGGRGVDVGRVLGSWQADELRSHSHTVLRGASEGDDVMTATNGWGPNNPAIPTSEVGGPETRPRNIALLACIKL